MQTLTLWLVLLVLQFTLCLISYKLFGITGLYVWVGAAVLIANIQVLKNVELLGLSATLGNAIYGSINLSTDLLNEKYGKNTSKRAVYLGFFSLVSFTLIMQVVLRVPPSLNDFAQAPMETLFSFLPRISAGSLIAFLISQLSDVHLFELIRKFFPSRGMLWIRNNGSTLISQLIDSVIFVLIAFWGIYPAEVLWQIVLSTYLIKALSALIDTPFVYLMRSMNPIWELGAKIAK